MVWITDRSEGFKVEGNVITLVDDTKDVFNCMWEEGDGVSSGIHYWKITFLTLEDGAGVGFTSKSHFSKGHYCRALSYLGNLSDGISLLVCDFGPIPSAGDVIGILAVFQDDRLRIYFHINDRHLGLAFNVPASTFKSIFPCVSFHKLGSAICHKVTETPNIFHRTPPTFVGIEGDWNLINIKKNGKNLELKITSTAKIRQEKETNVYSWVVQAVNKLNNRLFNNNGTWYASPVCKTLILGLPDLMEIENPIKELMEGVIFIELEANANLSVKSDEISSVWTRFDVAPEPFYGEPFIQHINAAALKP